jgi:hypothetical protein
MGMTVARVVGYAERAAYLRQSPYFADIPGTRLTAPSFYQRQVLATLAREMKARGLYSQKSPYRQIEWSIRSLADCLREP